MRKIVLIYQNVKKLDYSQVYGGFQVKISQQPIEQRRFLQPILSIKPTTSGSYWRK